jgi:hypothetical protein
MEKIRKYGSIVVVFIGLGLIFMYIRSKAPHESSLEFILPEGGVHASRIMLDYRKIEEGGQEPYRRVDRFPKAAVLKIVDRPSLPEGEYVVTLKLWIGDKVKSFKKRYVHGSNDVTRFEIIP